MGSAVSQVIQGKWSWREVGASAVAGGARFYAGDAVGSVMKGLDANVVRIATSTAASVAGSWASSQVLGYSSAETRARVSQAFISGLGQGIGNAIGESLASSGGVDWSKAPDQFDAETAKLNRYEAAAAASDSSRVIGGYDFGASQRYFDSVASAPGVELADASGKPKIAIGGFGWKPAFKLDDGTQVLRSNMDADDPRRMIADLALDADVPNVPGYVYHADKVFERSGTRDVYYMPTAASADLPAPVTLQASNDAKAVAGTLNIFGEAWDAARQGN